MEAVNRNEEERNPTKNDSNYSKDHNIARRFRTRTDYDEFLRKYLPKTHSKVSLQNQLGSTMDWKREHLREMVIYNHWVNYYPWDHCRGFSEKVNNSGNYDKPLK